MQERDPPGLHACATEYSSPGMPRQGLRAPTGGGNTCDIVDISRVFQGDDELVSCEQAQLTVVGSGFRGCSLPVQACGVGSCSRMCGASGALLAWRAMLCFLLPLRLSALASAPVLGEVVALEEGGR